MSEYSQYSHRWVASMDSLRTLTDVLVLLRNANRKRKEPVEKYVNNLKSNIQSACILEQTAYKRYELAVSELKCMDIVSCDWIPTFEKLKEIAMTSDERDA